MVKKIYEAKVNCVKSKEILRLTFNSAVWNVLEKDHVKA